MKIFEKWIKAVEEEYGTTKGNGEEYLIISEDTSGLLNVRHRITEENLREMFGDIINDADSLEEVYAEDLRDRSEMDPEGETELHRKDWNYDDIIQQWVDRGLVFERGGGE